MFQIFFEMNTEKFSKSSESDSQNQAYDAPPIQNNPAPPSYSQIHPPGMQPYGLQSNQPVLLQQPVAAIRYVVAPVLSHNSQWITCPSCGSSVMTRVEYESSSKTHFIALIFFVLSGCCCCVPYCELQSKLLGKLF